MTDRPLWSAPRHIVKLISRRFPHHSGRATVVLVLASLSALALGLGMLAVTR